MPVIGIPVERLRTLMQTDVTREELLRHLGHLGCDVEGFTELRRVGCRRCHTVHEMTETEEVPPHVVVNAVHPPAALVEEGDRLRSDEAAATGHEDALHEPTCREIVWRWPDTSSVRSPTSGPR